MRTTMPMPTATKRARSTSMATRAAALMGLAAFVVAATTFAAATWADEPAPPPIATDATDELAPTDRADPAGTGRASSQTGVAAAAASGERHVVIADEPAGAPLSPAQRAVDDDDLIVRGLAYEAVGLPLDAQGAFRRAERAGLADKGVEAGRRADALAELEDAAMQAMARKSRPAKAALASAVQTLERQARDAGWPIAPGLAAHIAQVAGVVGDGRVAKAYLARAQGSDAAVVADFAAVSAARRSKLRLSRCLGGPEVSEANAAVATTGGDTLVTGATGRGDGQQVWTWIVDGVGRVRRAGGFGAAGRDRAVAAVAVGAGAWIVGETSGLGGGDALVLRVDGQLLPVAQQDIHLGGREVATDVVLDGSGKPWVLVDAAVSDPSGPHRAIYLLGLGADGKPTKQVRIDLGRRAFATSLLVDKSDLIVLGGRGVGASAGGFVRTIAAASGVVDPAEGPDFPGPVLAAYAAGRGSLVALGAAGDGRSQRLWIGGRDSRGRWSKPKQLPSGVRADRIVALAYKRSSLALMVPAANDRASEAGIFSVDGRGKVAPLLVVPGFVPRAALPSGRNVVVVGTAQGCGRRGADAAWALLTP